MGNREQLIAQVIDRTLLGGVSAAPEEIPGMNPGHREAEQLEVLGNSTDLLQRLRPLVGAGTFICGFLFAFGAVTALRK